MLFSTVLVSFHETRKCVKLRNIKENLQNIYICRTERQKRDQKKDMIQHQVSNGIATHLTNVNAGAQMVCKLVCFVHTVFVKNVSVNLQCNSIGVIPPFEVSSKCVANSSQTNVC